ncbi:hypothetical protein [Brevundimonas subvibrioides]|uniref:Putative integral membrane protein n=1 Tax=Brevundimonas subvibrioides (strain ATCC 15264 / DSM 4735 / LMG 14903 / NBRC 16000 / CB 81) TaxID=633149 RepID=D9QL07_BRESC|nr:hypothetical protein [Brevundimonas subvibrioides]ADL01821.1 putative integral membrane protein [Brevundimonas subvibrioides ATCC 15264]
MRNKPSLFTAAERRIGLLALLGAVVLTLAIMVAERAFAPSLGIYGSSAPTLQMPDVVDARPLSRAA